MLLRHAQPSHTLCPTRCKLYRFAVGSLSCRVAQDLAQVKSFLQVLHRQSCLLGSPLRQQVATAAPGRRCLRTRADKSGIDFKPSSASVSCFLCSGQYSAL